MEIVRFYVLLVLIRNRPGNPPCAKRAGIITGADPTDSFQGGRRQELDDLDLLTVSVIWEPS